MIDYSILLDGALALLLVIAILYCWRLDIRLKNLRSGKDGMLQAAKELQSAVADAEKAIGMLRQSSDAAGRDLQNKIDQARAAANTPMPAATPSTNRQNPDFALRRRNTF